MKVYLAGPMSGRPAFNIPLFDAAADMLRNFGHEVVSPAEVDGETTRAVLLQSEAGDHADLPPGDGGWAAYLSRDFLILADEGIEAIVTLPEWETSRGARLEVLMATELGIPRFDYYTFLEDVGDGQCETLPNGDCTAESCMHTLYDSDGDFVNPERQRSIQGGVKDNRSKPRVDLIPSRPLMAVGKVLAFGARKYKPHNWRLGLGWSDTYASAMRHLLSFMDGDDIDPESGEPHIINALCQVLFLAEYYLTDTGTDDRWCTIDKETAQA